MKKSRFVFVGTAANTMVPCPQAFPEFLTGSDTDACTLEIYGNANEDDTIDMLGFTFSARIICWLEKPVALADANFDGEIWKIL